MDLTFNGMVKCSKCGKQKQAKMFPADYKIYGNVCRVCLYPSGNNGKQGRHVKKVKSYSKYGLLPEQIKDLFNKQQGCCAVCSKQNNLVLNRDKKTRQARGFVCRRCSDTVDNLDNPALKQFIDNPPAKEFYENK